MLLFYDPCVLFVSFKAWLRPLLTTFGHTRSITSILTCHFILSLRQFDNTVADTTTSGPGYRAQERTGLGDMLQFAAQPSNSLPSFIASFAQPVYVESAPSETDSDKLVDDGSEWRELDVVAPTENVEDAIAPESGS